VTGLGVTVFGASKVFTLSMAGPVSVSPAAVLAVRPDTCAEMVAGRFGSTLASASQSVPAASFAAIASTRGSVMSPCV
jgi:hypothetical protein